jgi:hypothetical protein
MPALSPSVVKVPGKTIIDQVIETTTAASRAKLPREAPAGAVLGAQTVYDKGREAAEMRARAARMGSPAATAARARQYQRTMPSHIQVPVNQEPWRMGAKGAGMRKTPVLRMSNSPIPKTPVLGKAGAAAAAESSRFKFTKGMKAGAVAVGGFALYKFMKRKRDNFYTHYYDY